MGRYVSPLPDLGPHETLVRNRPCQEKKLMNSYDCEEVGESPVPILAYFPRILIPVQSMMLQYQHFIVTHRQNESSMSSYPNKVMLTTSHRNSTPSNFHNIVQLKFSPLPCGNCFELAQ